ncbi:hypothetical protein AURDEDRAFT_178432 [Auricularia subglabra TFB-10046 SS5]|uniref:Uncharacterized protein n=1 Tax=Auricularia subglabra (strain TFB-10046 / SS5) TaxID=717982 RepID=J0D1N9_AURST|nr:hypothetical protein AURDEDRAFT_178432 [Auricularia subglabra TFB-10046 SS5]
MRRLVKGAERDSRFLQLQNLPGIALVLQELLLLVPLAVGRQYLECLLRPGLLDNLKRISLVFRFEINGLRLEEFVSSICRGLPRLTAMSVDTTGSSFGAITLSEMHLHHRIDNLRLNMVDDFTGTPWVVDDLIRAKELSVSTEILHEWRVSPPSAITSKIRQLEVVGRQIYDCSDSWETGSAGDSGWCRAPVWAISSSSDLLTLSPLLAPKLTSLIIDGVSMDIESLSSACAHLTQLQRLDLYLSHWVSHGTRILPSRDREEQFGTTEVGEVDVALAPNIHRHAVGFLETSLPVLVNLTMLHIGRNLQRNKPQRNALASAISGAVQDWPGERRGGQKLTVAIGRHGRARHTVVFPRNSHLRVWTPPSTGFEWATARQGETALDIRDPPRPAA